MDIALSQASLRAGFGTETAHGVIPPGLFRSLSWSRKAGIPPGSLQTEGDKDPKPWDPKGRTWIRRSRAYGADLGSTDTWTQHPGMFIPKGTNTRPLWHSGIWDGTEGAGTFPMEDSMPTAGGGNEGLLKVPSKQTIPRLQHSVAPGMAAPGTATAARNAQRHPLAIPKKPQPTLPRRLKALLVIPTQVLFIHVFLIPSNPSSKYGFLFSF